MIFVSQVVVTGLRSRAGVECERQEKHSSSPPR